MPTATTNTDFTPMAAAAIGVFISPMTAEKAQSCFPAISGLPPRSRVFVVVSEIGQPLLVANTHAEARSQVAAQRRYVLRTCH